VDHPVSQVIAATSRLPATLISSSGS